ncbi:MAG: type II toxin-antitoxin system PemK/MazF family toxin [Nitrospiraceae bacterium]|nr:type II toxin-antitoxin system PemK/MazF family toxin [Nitrospiraceae bacterium]
MAVVASRFEVYLVRLDSTQGHEIRKTRPGLIISPDEMNRHIGTVIVAPMTSKSREYPTRVPVKFQGKSGQVVLDQIRTVDKTRLVKRLGRINQMTADRVLALLAEMFAP